MTTWTDRLTLSRPTRLALRNAEATAGRPLSTVEARRVIVRWEALVRRMRR